MADTNNRVWAASTPGKRHSPADVRRDKFQDSGGTTGLIAAGGGAVGLTPGTPMSVRLDPCSVVARSEYAGRGDESYSFTVKSPQDVSIRTTGSGGGRTDVVGWVVSDPVFEGKEIAETDAEGNVVPGSPGLDPNEYDYWRPHVFENVPSSAARNTDTFRDWVRDNKLIEGMAVPYAKVVQGPDSVGLEGKVTPFFDTILGRYSFYENDVPISGVRYLEGGFSSYQSLGPIVPFEIPPWATRVKLKVFINGAYGSHGTASGRMSGLIMDRTMRQQNYSIPQAGDDPSHWVRESFIVSADMYVPKVRRGTTQTFQWRVTNVQSGSRIGVTDSMTHIFLEAHFFEDPSAVDNSEPA